jgi:polyhydroxybutyrate depolymerase
MTCRFQLRRNLFTFIAAVWLWAMLGVAAAQPVPEVFAGRTAYIYTPANLPAMGRRALVVVLHGGLGNAERLGTARIESALNMNAVADQGGFVVAYLSGTPVARMLGPDKLGWNAGACCGQPAENKVDDVTYLRSAVGEIASKYGVDPARIFGVGHSNGAMMTQRMVCETTLYAAAVAVSGALESGASHCPAARGKRILAIHGADDTNVPVAGGRGKGLARVDFASQAATAKVWQDSGAHYDLRIIEGTDHSVQSISRELLKTGSYSLAQTMARFLGLLEH